MEIQEVTNIELSDNFQMINLSKQSLTVGEESLLKKGLGFVPITRFDPFVWLKDIHLFVRKVKWRKFFKTIDARRCEKLGITEDDLEGVYILTENERNPGDGPFTDLRPTSKRMPPPMESTNIDVFLSMVTTEIEALTHTPNRYHPNLTEEELTSLLSLEKDSFIIIKPSDKGGEPGGDGSWYIQNYVP